ncbi:HEPN domain-containing protein [Paludisphaera rhizosphaerae]|uniref:HEPN domain-containing protein n=1 Tax=Paludisphaera rhizosphaerae TaxID=2711216 RepID=UPI0013EBBE97|nr:HEPN domain-containing protein [Paludisphaera rhizosphaerae]
MNRTDLQQLAEERVRDAKALLDAACWSGAYYLVGYAVECALKACIAKQTDQHDFPDKARVNDSYSHDLRKLVKVAGLEAPFDQDILKVPASQLALNWQTVKDWSEAARYETASEVKAREMYEAVADGNEGVLAWIRRHW